MSYQKRTRQGPEVGVGGWSSSESMLASGGKKRGRKTRVSKKGGRVGACGVRARPAGIVSGKGHHF